MGAGWQRWWRDDVQRTSDFEAGRSVVASGVGAVFTHDGRPVVVKELVVQGPAGQVARRELPPMTLDPSGRVPNLSVHIAVAADGTVIIGGMAWGP